MKTEERAQVPVTVLTGFLGAGKTTFALEYLPQVAGCTNFINADLIAACRYRAAVSAQPAPPA